MVSALFALQLSYFINPTFFEENDGMFVLLFFFSGRISTFYLASFDNICKHHSKKKSTS